MSREVKAPDGMIIYNVPDNITDEEAVKIYNKKEIKLDLDEDLPQKEIEQIKEEDSDVSYAADFGRAITRIGSVGPKMVADAVNTTAKLFGAKDDVISDKFRKSVNYSFANAYADIVPDVKVSDIMDEETKVRPTKTAVGVTTEIAPYFIGGSAIYGSKLLQSLPVIVKGAIAGGTVDQLLYTGEEGNIFNALNESEFLQAKGMAKDITEFLATDEDDSALEERIKLMAEGLIIGGAIDSIISAPKFLSKAKQMFNRRPSQLTAEEQSEVFIDYLKEAKEDVQYKSRKTEDLGFKETAETASQVAQQNSGNLRRFMQQVFTSRGYWTPAAFNAFEDSQYAQRQIVAESENIANRLQKSLRSIGDEASTKEASEKVQQALKDELGFHPIVTEADKINYVSVNYNVSKEIAEEILNARKLIDDMSKTLANSSIPDQEFKETILNNAGSYLRRSYRLYEDSGYKPSENIVQQAEDYLVQQQLKKAKDMDIEEAYSIARGQIDAILKSGKDATEVTDYYSKVRRVNTEILKKKEDIPEPIRKLMGEITEPSENIVLTVSKLARLTENNQFFESLNRFGINKYIFKDPMERNGVEYVTQITGTNSVLDGKYTTPEMLKAIKERESVLLQGPNVGLVKFLRNFSTAKGGSQAAKTIYSHVTHLRNILGGAQFGIANGVNPFGTDGLKTFQVLKNRIARGGEKELDSLYEKYLRLGIINTNVRVNEFRALLDTGYSSDADSLLDNLSKKLEGYGFSKEAQRLPAEVYMAVDDFYKIANFNSELETLKKAFPDESLDVLESKASKIVQNTFPNYDRVPKGIKALRYMPVGNFVAFPTEMWRTSSNIIKQAAEEINSGNNTLKARGLQRLAGFSTAMAGTGVIASSAAQLAGFSNEEADAVQKLSETPWSKAPRNIVRIDDKVYVNDTQFIDSYSPIKTPFLEIYRGVQEGELKGQDLDEYLATSLFNATKSLLAPYAGESIITEAMSDIFIALKDPEGRTPSGQPLFVPGKPKTDQMIDGIAHIISAFEPGSFTSIRNLAQAAFETPNRTTGKPKDLNAELFTNLTGIRFTEFSTEDSLTYATKQYLYERRLPISMKADYTKEPASVREDYINREKQQYKNQQEFYLKIKAAETLMGRPNTVKILKDSGLSSKEIGAILSGYFRPEKPTMNMVVDILMKTPFTERESKKEFISDLFSVYADFQKTKLIPVDEEEGNLRQQTEEIFRREEFARGGEVRIPQAPNEPDERIDKMTGLPYNIQAGKAFIDDEDPEKRMLFSEGGIISKALGIKDEDISWAKNLGKSYGKDEELDGRGDAARHLALGWLAKKAEYPNAAKFAINAREYIEFDRMKNMDIANNKKGFEIDAEDKESVEKIIKQMIEDKEAKFMSPQESRKARGY